VQDAVVASYRNQLLSRLPQAQLALLSPHLEWLDMPLGTPMERPREPISHIYFPESGMGSVVAVGNRGERIEVGVFGREGMSGTMVVMGSDRSPLDTMAQMPGSAHRIAVAPFREAMREVAQHGTGLREVFLRYAQSFAIQTAYTALANGRLKIEERLARWLLMCHDRADGDALHLTHEFLSIMLGVRRAGVTVALHLLEGQGMVRSTRGRVQVLDRGGLEDVAREVYGLPEAEYARLLPQMVPGRRAVPA